MKIFVTGYTGQLGSDIVREGLERGLNITGVGSNDLDITDCQAVLEYVRKLKPDVIIHCAAYTAVDRAEDDQETCWRVNVEGTKHLVSAAKECNSKFLYISTDYVFNGNGNVPFTELDQPNPIGYYGLTKYEGEKVVQSILSDWFIIRISWVYGIKGQNFVKTMLRLGETKDEIPVVNDQIGSPTYTYDLARLLLDMIPTSKYGIYHVSNEGFCSWADFAKEIFKLANKNMHVIPIQSEDYPTRALRPKNSQMSKRKLVESGFQPLPKWQESLKHFIKQIVEEVRE
jgi:dTDP-4-dehydrorhamnose reductase